MSPSPCKPLGTSRQLAVLSQCLYVEALMTCTERFEAPGAGGQSAEGLDKDLTRTDCHTQGRPHGVAIVSPADKGLATFSLNWDAMSLDRLVTT